MKKLENAQAIINEAIRRAERRQRRGAEVVDKILPGNIPAGMVLHFWDNNLENGHFSNLVVCPSKEYSDYLNREILKKFGSYEEFIKSRARFRKDLKRERQRERIDRILDTRLLWNT